ncbi:hypothetical protein BD410DRAFT_804660 [Rickenella mellea]|uniref:Uncharacterized protein n=1 Tax=Rickenella mellea TaxID=50990 RepID=A0A4Y7Q0Q4_9AGAM|nr:hypothetical protein BD410DRAFT_804660 [Rickenella mellea]
MTDSSKSESREELTKLVDNGIENNFGEFKAKSKFQLKHLGLWKYIEGPLSVPPVIPKLVEPKAHQGLTSLGELETVTTPGNAEEVEQAELAAQPWFKGNDDALSKIVRAVPERQIHLVTEAIYAKEAWEALCSVYQPGNSVQAANLVGTIMSHCCTGNVREWLDELLRLRGQLCAIEPDCMTDKEFALTILNLMPLDLNWRNFVSGLQAKVLEKEENNRPITSISVTCREGPMQCMAVRFLFLGGT